MGRQTPFTKVQISGQTPEELRSELNRLQDRLVEGLRVLRQSPQQLVTQKGSILAASGNGAPMEHKASATDGLPLVTDSTQTTGLAYSKLSVAAAVSGVLPVANGGTGNATGDATTLLTQTWAVPAALGSTTPAAVTCTTLTSNTAGAGLLTQEAWTALSGLYVNSWVDFGAPHMAGGYMKDSQGFVHLRGLIKNGVAANVATLPSGYRPSATVNYGIESNSAFGNLSISSAGLITLGTYSNLSVQLDGITFDTR